MADNQASRPLDRRDADYRQRVVQWGEQQIIKDYTLHIDHDAQSAMWHGPSPLGVTYHQALLIFEELEETYPDAFEIEGTPRPEDEAAHATDDGHDEAAEESREKKILRIMNTHHRNGAAAQEMNAKPEAAEGDASRSSDSKPDPAGAGGGKKAQASGTSYSKTVHYDDEKDEINISREVVLSDDGWDEGHRPSLHVHPDGALLKMHGHPVTEFTSARSLRAMAALFKRAAVELERGDWE